MVERLTPIQVAAAEAVEEAELSAALLVLERQVRETTAAPGRDSLGEVLAVEVEQVLLVAQAPAVAPLQRWLAATAETVRPAASPGLASPERAAAAAGFGMPPLRQELEVLAAAAMEATAA